MLLPPLHNMKTGYTYMLPSVLWKSKHIHEAKRDIRASLFFVELEVSVEDAFFVGLFVCFVVVIRFNFIRSAGKIKNYLVRCPLENKYTIPKIYSLLKCRTVSPV